LDFVPCSDLFPEIFRAFHEQTNTKLSFADSAIAYVAEQRAEDLLLTFDDELRAIAGIQTPR
jgi:predicted nucleic acid-binding protein